MPPISRERPDVRLRGDKHGQWGTALLGRDALGEYFHLGAARLLNQEYEGTLLYVRINERLAELDQIISTSQGRTLSDAVWLKTKFAKWRAGYKDPQVLRQKLRLLKLPITPVLSLASYDCFGRDNVIHETERPAFLPAQAPQGVTYVHNAYTHYVNTSADIWAGGKFPEYAESNATPAVANAFSIRPSLKTWTRCLTAIRAGWLDLLPAENKAKVQNLAKEKMKSDTDTPKIVIWSRLQNFEPIRNVTDEVLRHLIAAARAAKCQVILAGDSKLTELVDGQKKIVTDLKSIQGTYDLREFYQTDNGEVREEFANEHFLLLQLYFFYHLYQKYNLAGIIGAKSGFIDAFGFLGIPLLSLEFAETIRFSRIAPLTHIPHYFVMPSAAFVGAGEVHAILGSVAQPTRMQARIIQEEMAFIKNFTSLCIDLGKRRKQPNPTAIPATARLSGFVTKAPPGSRQGQFLNAEFNDDKVGFIDQDRTLR